MQETFQECGICYESIENEKWYKDIKCSHKFHDMCLKVHINEKEIGKQAHYCPTCSAPYNAKALLNETFQNNQEDFFKKTQLAQLQGDTTCTICHQSYTEDNLPYEAPCNHFFHKACIENWNKECESNRRNLTCSYCRKVFEVQNIKLRMDIYNKLLKLSQPTESQFQIFLRTLEGHCIVISVTATTTISQFCGIVQQRTQIKQTEQLFSFNGKSFSFNQKEKKLIDFNVQKNSTINLLLRLKGGNFKSQIISY